ncbi:hypothetical protein ACA506_004471 [Vibrio parahaemolyticus]
MKLGLFFGAIFELCMLIIFSGLCLVVVLFFGWWVPASDGLSSLFDKVPARFQWLVFPFSFLLMLCMPFYAIAAIGFRGLEDARQRFSIVRQDIVDSLG